jgi:pimeloyl-ACP methyl ester carboxylesterase
MSDTGATSQPDGEAGQGQGGSSPPRPVQTGTGLTVVVAEPQRQARMTLYALHGGGLNGSYWDCASDPDLSLVRLAVSLGYRVVYPDRPGYRANRDRWPDGLPPDDEAALHVETIRSCWGEAPVVLVGHSAGAMVSLHAAALVAWPGLRGVDYSGVGIQLDPRPDEDARSRVRFWGPAELYPPGTFESGVRPTEPTIAHDGESARRWGERFSSIASMVRVPVRVTFADHERWWGGVHHVLAAVAQGYTRSVEVQTSVEYGAGHNLSVGYAARSYHLGVLAFAERCGRRAAD